eukprot:TRINITY_DN4530_c0_g1_i1.p1 TRINITY_DN4530_c0_g1~~TRINITY_DN4530_c0_g1_i1.p1  ORF type:complete len:251 (+),score=23.37 TRINITY_DN4530_c0_g1_i1:88-840(+)
MCMGEPTVHASALRVKTLRGLLASTETVSDEASLRLRAERYEELAHAQARLGKFSYAEASLRKAIDIHQRLLVSSSAAGPDRDSSLKRARKSMECAEKRTLWDREPAYLQVPVLSVVKPNGRSASKQAAIDAAKREAVKETASQVALATCGLGLVVGVCSSAYRLGSSTYDLANGGIQAAGYAVQCGLAACEAGAGVASCFPGAGTALAVGLGTGVAVASVGLAAAGAGEPDSASSSPAVSAASPPPLSE